ncbi:hypothetical protein EV363DRAFT_1402676 [Boletus edulis]|uniref:Uncharacterized protein n=1 Tax=Boletus edulis BED1 TaxID=1328754 RepID=A0AAD4BDR4_BOLED|nr:hypothetical protein EV363DRAFT_1402676 [Boletus edulis]KAF8423185.1 hypothetical protein L210DRAFT_672305 [Boletus edulis BED1]
MCFTRAHSILKCTFRIGAGETRLLILAVLVHVRVAWQHRFGKSFDGGSDQACIDSISKDVFQTRSRSMMRWRHAFSIESVGHRLDYTMVVVGWLSRQRLVE